MAHKTLATTSQNKEPWLAVSLSWLIPGAGQLYTRNYLRGAIFIVLAIGLNIFFIATLISARLSFLVSCMIGSCAFLLLPILACIDTFKLAKQSNTKEFEADRLSNKDKWLAIFLSLLLPGLGHGYLHKWFWCIFYIICYFFINIILENITLSFFLIALFEAFVCIHIYMISPRLRHYSANIIKFIFIFLLVTCIKERACPFVVRQYFLEAFKVSSECMAPLIKQNDRVIGNKLAYYCNELRPNDIILFRMPKEFGEKENHIAIKRIAAVGGETIHIKDGKIYVNEQERKLHYPNIEMTKDHSDEKTTTQVKISKRHLKFAIGKPYHVPENHFFLLGDNIEYSVDSRYFGAIPRKEIIGKVTKIYWPLRRISLLY